MKVTRSHSSTTINYNIEDGPIIGTSPHRLRQGQFQIERIALTYHNGKINQAFVRGRNVLPDGSFGKLNHDRTLLVSEFPDWLAEFVANDGLMPE